jgi:hypothetical protein
MLGNLILIGIFLALIAFTLGTIFYSDTVKRNR